jgi:hypothetical protein
MSSRQAAINLPSRSPHGGASGCPVKLEGFATVNANGVATTTGGGNATPIRVTTFADLMKYAQDNTARVIEVSGTIKTTDGGGSAMSVASNKTIVGVDKNAKIHGGIVMSGVSNVIIRNLRSAQGRSSPRPLDLFEVSLPSCLRCPCSCRDKRPGEIPILVLAPLGSSG